jgi:hypothetical protein
MSPDPSRDEQTVAAEAQGGEDVPAGEVPPAPPPTHDRKRAGTSKKEAALSVNDASFNTREQKVNAEGRVRKHHNVNSNLAQGGEALPPAETAASPAHPPNLDDLQVQRQREGRKGRPPPSCRR